MKAKQKDILQIIIKNPLISSKEIHKAFSNSISYATVKRMLNDLWIERLIIKRGQGRATKYEISPQYTLLHPIDPDEYFEKEIDERQIRDQYQFEIIRDILPHAELFKKNEMEHLQSLQQQYQQRIGELSQYQYKKEMERLAIDLSWKSSQIEGNTYTLLETERLLKEKLTAGGKSKDEAIMLLNHKEAIDFVVGHSSYVVPLSISRIEDLHSMLTKELSIDRNIRNKRIGISGTNYQPLDNEFQIMEAMHEMCILINNKRLVFEKALLAILLLSYIQPFMDGNKRTARILSNAILIHHGYCPISFRTVDSLDYKKAILIFYEQNNITIFKEIFIEQFEFAVKTYF